jgi:hypothetical protein
MRTARVVPDGPGVGVELEPDAAERSSHRMGRLGPQPYDDGSAMDQ